MRRLCWRHLDIKNKRKLPEGGQWRGDSGNSHPCSERPIRLGKSPRTDSSPFPQWIYIYKNIYRYLFTPQPHPACSVLAVTVSICVYKTHCPCTFLLSIFGFYPSGSFTFHLQIIALFPSTPSIFKKILWFPKPSFQCSYYHLDHRGRIWCRKKTPLCLGKRKLARVHPNTRGVRGGAVRRTVTF